MQKNNIIANAEKEIENFEDKLGENFYDAFQEDDNLTIDMARGILHAFSDCKTEREFPMTCVRKILLIISFSFQSKTDILVV